MDAMTRYELRFEYLNRIGRAVAFPCDRSGRVDVDALSPSLRSSYQQSRSRVGRDLAYPAVVSRGQAGALQ